MSHKDTGEIDSVKAYYFAIEGRSIHAAFLDVQCDKGIRRGAFVRSSILPTALHHLRYTRCTQTISRDVWKQTIKGDRNVGGIQERQKAKTVKRKASACLAAPWNDECRFCRQRFLSEQTENRSCPPHF